ncbi:MAG: FAD-binding protein, partial [Clostridia bacterium]|nr:FAD-binding protein [Clostridia bacterium]
MSELLPDIPVDKEFCLAKHTTVGVGGNAVAFFPQSIRRLCSLARLCERLNMRYFPLGAGSNVLPPDGDYSGVIIATDNFRNAAVDGTKLTVEAGMSVSGLLSLCKKRGLSGLEFLAGIPAKVGGLVYMNAGVHAGHVADKLESVTFLRHGKIITLPAKHCAFGYKDSIFQHYSCFILSARFALEQSMP